MLHLYHCFFCFKSILKSLSWGLGAGGQDREETCLVRLASCHVFSSLFMSSPLVSCHVLLYVMSCHVMSFHFLSCRLAWHRFVRSHHLFSCPVWFVFSRPVGSCRVVFVSRRVRSCHLFSCHVSSSRALFSCHVLSSRVMLCVVMSYSIMSLRGDERREEKRGERRGATA